MAFSFVVVNLFFPQHSLGNYNTYPALTYVVFLVSIVSYEPSFSTIDLLPKREAQAINRRRKNEDMTLTVQTEKPKLVRYLLYLYCVPDGFGNNFNSRGTASNF